MDPADSTAMFHALQKQGLIVQQHAQGIFELREEIKELCAEMRRLAIAVQPRTPEQPAKLPAIPPSNPMGAWQFREPQQPPPERFGGEPERCKAFLLQCDFVFRQQPLTYPTDERRIGYVMGLLKGKALDWATAVWSGGSFPPSYMVFTEEIRKVFQHASSDQEPSQQLIALRQGLRSAADHSIDFRTIAAATHWNNSALADLFRASLNGALQDELAHQEPIREFDALVRAAIRLDNRYRLRRTERPVPPGQPYPRRVPASLTVENQDGVIEPMDISRAGVKISPEERRRRRETGACFYCGEERESS
ncbi:hypothetical protein SKAU_G00364040 [Synaphobranchus kaupii]|uniref:Retrotransposon gag domain-containing protein n=1 Tax=Synaphobranchus kaupii TaxID=118154 RepID=A0A9Q1EIZ8_SYNKA|nr:hypothetical protein SKAU_G00364040 [Synaphobranchus kaupii]